MTKLVRICPKWTRQRNPGVGGRGGWRKKDRRESPKISVGGLIRNLQQPESAKPGTEGRGGSAQNGGMAMTVAFALWWGTDPEEIMPFSST